MKYMHPRPSSIVAALYTARDLEVDVAILHGPSGCSFKHARLLEEDGMRVLTTSLADNEFIFGGQKSLEDVLRYAEDHFAPKRMVVIGTCVSMIIGEDLQSAIDGCRDHDPDHCRRHPCRISGEYRRGACHARSRTGWQAGSREEELTRQQFLMQKANEVERLRGAACKPYIEPSRGDLKHMAAQRLAGTCARSGAKGSRS